MVSASYQCRRFSHVKFFLLILYVLKFDLPEGASYYQQLFQRDSAFCANCFARQSEECSLLYESLSYDEDFAIRNFLNFILPPAVAVRETGFLKINTNANKIVAKHFGRVEKLQPLLNELTADQLTKRFSDPQRLDGFQYCPSKSLKRFARALASPQSDPADVSFWLYMVVNVQPLLLPLLKAQHFPVPAIYGTCGFTQFQQYSGRTLRHFYTAGWETKLRIAKLLLEAVVKFSHGFNGYRIYVTDLNADNVAYNEAEHQLYFIDLDTVLIVDSSVAAPVHKAVHRHVYIECYDCFAYSQQDICEHRLSDINLFAACQLLREDLRKDRAKGFLYAENVPEEYANIMQLLDLCVDCDRATCNNRFDVVFKLINELQRNANIS